MDEISIWFNSHCGGNTRHLTKIWIDKPLTTEETISTINRAFDNYKDSVADKYPALSKKARAEVRKLCYIESINFC